MRRIRKTVRPARKPYRFTLLVEKDKDLIEYLDSIPKPLRGMTIVEALRRLTKNPYPQKSNEGSNPLSPNPQEHGPEFKGSFNF